VTARYAAPVRARVIVAILVVVLAVYFVLLGERAFMLMGTGRPVAIGLGIGVIILPVIGVILTVFELNFGRRTQRLAQLLAAEDDLPDDSDLPKRPSGRVERSAADAHFDEVRARVEADEDDWRGWYHLAHAYDLSGDRKRARAAMRTAIEVETRTH
jgi:hypothetical protein